MTGLANLGPMNDATLRQRAVTKLKGLIVDGALKPGQCLTETELAAALCVSRGPIRELVDTGLLVSQPCCLRRLAPAQRNSGWHGGRGYRSDTGN